MKFHLCNHMLVQKLKDSINSHLLRTSIPLLDFLSSMETNRQIFDFPTKEDVIGSAVALVRLQDTYKLDIAELASGILNGIKYG